jgi:glycosyltransferase involved in cell wall biosynthesis
VISCLRRAGIEVVERHEPVWEGREHKWSAGARTAVRLLAAEARLWRQPKETFDVVVVGYPGHLDVPAAKHIAGRRPVVFNPLVSLADTLVGDRRRFRAGSLPARALAAIDRRALAAADLVVADTGAQAELFTRLGAKWVEVCFVGAEERLFSPGWSPPARFTALFVGKLIPLHGLETILAAAQLVPEVRFRIVGSGQLERLLDRHPQNLEHVPWLDYELLPGELHRASCALGVFGTSAKAQRVIPNKVFQALACGTPIVTADTPAARELLRDGTNALLVAPGDPEALADALRRLSVDAALARKLSVEGLLTYQLNASEEVLGARWNRWLQLLAG